jgi:hypothetical protein
VIFFSERVEYFCHHVVGATGVSFAVHYFLKYWELFHIESVFQINDVNN